MPSLSQRIRGWREESSVDSKEVIEVSHQFLQWSSNDYHDKFLDWLRNQADTPIKPQSSHADLICANARANTLREVRQHLIDEASRAGQALEARDGT